MWRYLFCLLSGLALVMAQDLSDPNVGYRLRERFWLPYEADAETLGLWRFDGQQELKGKAGEQALDELVATIDGPGDLLSMGKPPTAGPAGQGNIPDNALRPRPANALGAHALVPQGYLGGALELRGGDGVLVAQTYKELREPGTFTLEAWFKPQAMAADAPPQVLFALDSEVSQQTALELLRYPDGRLELRAMGKAIGEPSEPLVPADTWQHLTLMPMPLTVAQEGERPRSYASSVAVLRHGRTIFWRDTPRLWPLLKSLTGVVRVGNNSLGKSGFRGLVDECRLSLGFRHYYGTAWEWTDPAAARPLVNGPPAIRQADDCLFYAPLEPTATPPAGVTQTLRPASLANPAKPPATPDYLPGVRGQALLVQPEGVVPVWQWEKGPASGAGSVECWFMPWNWDNRRRQRYHDPMEYMPLLRLQASAEGKVSDFLSIGAFHKNHVDQPEPFPLRAGTWYHLLVTWQGKQATVYLNGEPVPGLTLYATLRQPATAATISSLLLEPLGPPGAGHQRKETVFDEVRLYHRALTAMEASNHFQRYQPQPRLTPLPFAFASGKCNVPQQNFTMTVELLDPRRDEVAQVAIRLLDPAGQPYAPEWLLAPEDGRATLAAKAVPIRYGDQLAQLSFRRADGSEIAKMAQPVPHPQPAWLGNRLGIHEDQVLPGWEPLVVDRETGKVGLVLRELQFNAAGLLDRLRSRDAEMFTGPMRVQATQNGQPLTWTSTTPLTWNKVTPAAAHTLGRQEAAGWTLQSAIETEFDGHLKVTLTLSGPADAKLDKLALEFPLHSRHAHLLGAWTGGQNFRATTRYGSLPDKPGLLFTSLNPGRQKHAEIRGSFIPYVFLGDDSRGLAWFAESDRNWTRSGTLGAIEVERQGEETVLRLNLLSEPTAAPKPLSFVFGLQPTPIKPLPKNHRKLAASSWFGFVDSFSTQGLKTDAGTNSFQIYPENDDWDKVPARIAAHRSNYRTHFGYTNPILYIDRNYVALPPHVLEYGAYIFRGGPFSYQGVASDAHIWYMNEWLRRGAVAGFYIDDIWLATFRDPYAGPAYDLGGGGVQPGFEFFAYREWMKRLRWLFHDNGQEPLIWVHATATPYASQMAFADLILDGEERFVEWGEKRNFMNSWGHDRLRFANGEKLGLTQVWMNKIGNDKLRPFPMPHWQWRQIRAYHAGLLLHDVNNSGGLPEQRRLWQDLVMSGQDWRFRGYWEATAPVRTSEPQGRASLWQHGDRTLLILVNWGAGDKTMEFTVDLAGLGYGQLTPERLLITDYDDCPMPPGEDVTRIAQAKLGDHPVTEPDELGEMFEAAVKDQEKVDRVAAGEFLPDDKNFRWRDGKLTLQIRDHNYRLLELRPK